MNRRSFLKASTVAAGAAAVRPHALDAGESAAPPATGDLPLVDLHVHLTDEFPIERMLELAGRARREASASWSTRRTGRSKATPSCAVMHRPPPAPPGLHRAPAPGLQLAAAASRPALLAEVDYVLQDPQIFTMPDGEGGYLQIWEFNTYIDDKEEAFMEHYMEHSLRVFEHRTASTFSAGRSSFRSASPAIITGSGRPQRQAGDHRCGQSARTSRSRSTTWRTRPHGSSSSKARRAGPEVHDRLGFEERGRRAPGLLQGPSPAGAA